MTAEAASDPAFRAHLSPGGSSRLLRNFLRDRPNEIVLSIFVGTFAYAGGGLYEVGISAGLRVDEFPRFAVTVAGALLFVSLALRVFFAATHLPAQRMTSLAPGIPVEGTSPGAPGLVPFLSPVCPYALHFTLGLGAPLIYNERHAAAVLDESDRRADARRWPRG